jgi:hypothetical protein
MQLNGPQLYVLSSNSGDQNDPEQQQMKIPGAMEEGLSHYDISAFVDRIAGTIDFCVNGRRVGRAGNLAARRLPGIGKTVSVQTYRMSEGQLALSQMAVIPWSGQLPAPGAGAAEAITALSNGDAVFGTPTGMTDGKWKLESDVGPLELPAEKVQAVEFGGELQPVAAVGRLRLVDGSALLVDRFEWTPDGLAAHHALFGDLHFPASAVRELVFRPAPVRLPAPVEDAKKNAPADRAMPMPRGFIRF